MNQDVLIKILTERNYITSEEIEKAREDSKKLSQGLVEYLISNELITKNIIGQALSEHFSVPYFDLEGIKPQKKDVARIPKDVAVSKRVIFVGEDDKNVRVATDAVENNNLSQELASIFPGKEIVIGYSFPEDIDKHFEAYKKKLNIRFIQIMNSGQRIAPDIVSEVIHDARELDVSDIHFEPQYKDARVRFRIDGVLQNVGVIPLDFYSNVLNLIKVEALMKTDKHLSPQDGSFVYEENGAKIDIRVSTIPSVYGEKIVLRILSSMIKDLSLKQLGFSLKDTRSLTEVSKKPFGMVLAVGPTGSGKSTTLHAMLRMVNTEEKNITTIEDPVEYRTKGANHIQINKEADLTFANGLRSILRQDPDVILVGEIRDIETAEICVNAALTGHLVLSTLHANDAQTAVPRMLSMNIDPFLLASTLELVIAQRLARKTCRNCMYTVTHEKEKLKENYGAELVDKFFPEEVVTLVEGKGCAACNFTGYRGRTALFQVIKVSTAMKELILSNPSAGEVQALSEKEGSLSMFEDGMEKVRQGVTTLEELTRVAPFNQFN